jgi:hypothetical protein
MGIKTRVCLLPSFLSFILSYPLTFLLLLNDTSEKKREREKEKKNKFMYKTYVKKKG